MNDPKHYAIVDRDGVVVQIVRDGDLTINEHETIPLPDGYWLGDRRSPDDTWHHPVDITETGNEGEPASS